MLPAAKGLIGYGKLVAYDKFNINAYFYVFSKLLYMDFIISKEGVPIFLLMDLFPPKDLSCVNPGLAGGLNSNHKGSKNNFKSQKLHEEQETVVIRIKQIIEVK